MAHLDFRGLLCMPRKRGGHQGRRGRHGKGVEEVLIGDEVGAEEEQDSGVEVQIALDFNVKEPLASEERLTT